MTVYAKNVLMDIISQNLTKLVQLIKIAIMGIKNLAYV